MTGTILIPWNSPENDWNYDYNQLVTENPFYTRDDAVPGGQINIRSWTSYNEINFNDPTKNVINPITGQPNTFIVGAMAYNSGTTPDLLHFNEQLKNNKLRCRI